MNNKTNLKRKLDTNHTQRNTHKSEESNEGGESQVSLPHFIGSYLYLVILVLLQGDTVFLNVVNGEDADSSDSEGSLGLSDDEEEALESSDEDTETEDKEDGDEEDGSEGTLNDDDSDDDFGESDDGDDASSNSDSGEYELRDNEKSNNVTVKSNSSRSENKTKTKKQSEKTASTDSGINNEYEDHDTSDEEDIRNTVGNIPMNWYDEYKHLGYDWDGNQIIKPTTGDQIDAFLQRMEDPDFWKTVKDPQTGQDVVLSEEDIQTIRRIQGHKIPDATYDEYAVSTKMKTIVKYVLFSSFLSSLGQNGSPPK